MSKLMAPSPFNVRQYLRVQQDDICEFHLSGRILASPNNALQDSPKYWGDSQKPHGSFVSFAEEWMHNRKSNTATERSHSSLGAGQGGCRRGRVARAMWHGSHMPEEICNQPSCRPVSTWSFFRSSCRGILFKWKFQSSSVTLRRTRWQQIGLQKCITLQT